MSFSEECGRPAPAGIVAGPFEAPERHEGPVLVRAGPGQASLYADLEGSHVVLHDINPVSMGVVEETSRAFIQEKGLPFTISATTDRAEALKNADYVVISIEIGDRKTGLLNLVAVTPDGAHLQQVSDMLQQIKARFPDKLDVTLLLESDIPYERLVEMMDTLRVAQVQQEDEIVTAELFPAISIGDAPSAKLKTAERNEQ